MSGVLRWALVVLAVAAALAAAIEAFHGALFAEPPEGRWPHGVPAEERQVHMAAVYGGFAREAAEGGGLLAHNLHTAEPHAPTLARPKEWLVGRTLERFGLGALNALRVERLYAVGGFVAGVAALGAALLRRRATRIAFLAASVLGGTLYWLPPRVPWLAARPELWRGWLGPGPDAESGLGYGHLGQLLGAPHLALETGWFALAVALGVLAARRRDARISLATGAALLGLCSVRPYTLPIALTACLAAELPNVVGGARRGVLLRWAAVALPPAPLVVHLASVLRGDGVFATLDVVHPAPPPHEMALFVGLPALVVPVLVVRFVRRGQRLPVGPAAAALAAWTVVLLGLLHGDPWVRWEVEPMGVLLLLVPLACLMLFERLGARPATLAAFVALHAVGGAAWVDELWTRRSEPNGGLYLARAEYEALSHLDQTRPPDALTSDDPPVVLIANENLGPFVPWIAGVRTMLGHRDHTARYATKRLANRRLLATGEGLERARRAGATHLLIGPRDGPATHAWARRDPRLRLEWARDGVAVLRLVGPGAERDAPAGEGSDASERRADGPSSDGAGADGATSPGGADPGGG